MLKKSLLPVFVGFTSSPPPNANRVKTFKFKCVSKQWLSLISNPKFCHSHTRRHHTPNPTPTAILVNKGYTPTADTVCMVPFLTDFNVRHVEIRQSCNGLLPCSIYLDHDCDSRHFICNPTTKQFMQLSFPNQEYKDSAFALNLAFDPLKSPHYKVISIRDVCGYRDGFLIDTYSSETNSWTLLGLTFTMPDRFRLHDAVFCNGAIHWYSYVNSLYFDVDNECLKTMPMPALTVDSEFRYFGESCGHLHIVITTNPSALKFDVLEMAADYSQWFKRYHVDLDVVRIVIPEIIWNHEEENYFPFCVLGVIRAEKEEESMVVLFVDGRAVSYNPYNGTSKKLCDLQQIHGLNSLALDYQMSTTMAHQYFETLACV